jgi:hypothetical protein
MWEDDMVTVQLSEDLAKHLQDIARRQNRSIDEVVESIVRDKVSEDAEIGTDESVDPFDSIDGIVDSDITDMSTTVKETLREYFRKKHGGID